MKKFSINISLMILSFALSAQVSKPIRPYEKIKYDGLNPIWHETCYDSTVINLNLDGYSHFRPISNLPHVVYNNKIYSGYKLNVSEGIIGGYIECRDINTGKLIWRDRFGLNDGGHIEIPNILDVVDEKLIVYGQISRKPGLFKRDNGPLLDSLILSTRVYDLLDGTLYSHNHGDFDDFSLLNTKHDANYYHQVYFYKEKNNIRYLETSYINSTGIGDIVINSHLIDKDGMVVTKDSITSDQIYFNVAKISDDTLLIVELDSANLWFRYVSPQLETYYVVETKYPFNHPPFYIQLKDISTADRKILFFNSRNSHFPDNYFEIYVFNFDGTISHKYDLKKKYSDDFYPLKWADKDGLLLSNNILIQNNKTSKSYLDVKKITNETEIEVIKSFNSVDTLRDVYPLSITTLDNGKTLVLMAEGSLYVDMYNFIERDRDAIAYSYMLLDANILGITSESHDASVGKILGVNIIPNPTAQEGVVYFDTPFTGNIYMSDTNGHVMNEMQIFSQGIVTIDISKFESGMYIVHFISKNGEHIAKKVVKM